MSLACLCLHSHCTLNTYLFILLCLLIVYIHQRSQVMSISSSLDASVKVVLRSTSFGCNRQGVHARYLFTPPRKMTNNSCDPISCLCIPCLSSFVMCNPQNTCLISSCLTRYCFVYTRLTSLIQCSCKK